MSVYPPGSHIAARYEVVAQPLAGGMGIVYICFDHKGQRPVALKTFKSAYLPDRAARDRFLREGTTWVKLGRHLHVVRAYHIERIGDGREVYLVLELVAKEKGRQDASLRSWLAPGRPLPLEQAVLFALQIVRGMGHATGVLPGFVHRDLKPENVLVGADRLSSVDMNRLRVTDFGLASVLEQIEAGDREREGVREAKGGQGASIENPLGRTQLTRGIAGTPLYMAPEQWQARQVCTQTDMYALGCILYEMLAGRRAVEGDSIAVLERAHCEGRRQPLPDGVPQPVKQVVTRCLALEPGARYGSWADVEAALAAAYTSMTGQPAPAPELAEAAGRADQVALGWSYNHMGVAYLDIGKARVALQYFGRAQEIGNAHKDRALEAAGLGNQAHVYLHLGDARRAIGCSEQSLVINREIKYRYGQGVDLGNLGIAYKNLGDLQRAIGYYQHALAIWREVGDRREEGADLGNLGNVYLELGEVRQAIEFYERHLAIAREIGSRRSEGYALGNLGEAHRRLRDARLAGGFFEQALAIFQEIGDRRAEGLAFNNLGNVYDELGDAQRGITYWQQAAAIMEEIGDARGAAIVAFNLAQALVEQGRVAEALPYAERAVQVMVQIGYPGARQAQHLLSRIRAPGKVQSLPANQLRQALDALFRANSRGEVQRAIAQFPFMATLEFIEVVKQALGGQVSAGSRQSVEQRLTWLRQVIQEQKEKDV